MLITPGIKLQLGSWLPYFSKFIESPDMDELFAYIKQRAKVVKILPDSANVFRVFRETDIRDIKVIICGLCPYHTTYMKWGTKVSIADGLSLSCSSTWKEKGIQPSLEMVFQSLERELLNGFDPDAVYDGDLSYLAKQGVLLYNVALTTEEGRAASMNSQWEKFNKFFFTEIVNNIFSGLPILFLGTQAQRSANLLTPMLHYPILVSHPASASYQGSVWNSEGCWTKINNILMQNNGIKINWFKKKSEEIEEKRKVIEDILTDDKLPF